jgi:peptidyl-prolyl cis-trans isomerase B (cyclophilin B)
MLSCLLLAVSDVDPARQTLILEAARSLGNGALAAVLASPDETTAERAALAIGRTKASNGAALLVPYLNDKRDGVRAMSAYGLGLIASGEAATQIASLAMDDPSGAVRVGALDAIGRYEDAGRLRGGLEYTAFAAVRHAMLQDPNAAVRGRAAITLSFFADGAQGSNAATALVAAIFQERAHGVRERIMWAIFRRYAIRVPRAVLRSALHDSDDVVRIEAVRAYGKLKNADAIPDLRPLLGDRSWRVQEQANEAILGLEGKPATISWKAIPPYVHVPPVAPDPLASQTPQPRPSAKLAAPRAADADLGPPLTLHTAEQMLSPARGPHPRLRLVTTKGNIYVVLYPEWAPLTVANFINMMNAGFLDNNRWFRIVPDFVVQTGEQDDVNQPGPGYTIGAEENPLEQNAYVISMGLNYDPKLNTPERDSGGSEYYITLSPQYHLDIPFTVFGAVSGGFDVLAHLVESDRVERVERIGDATF